MQTKNKTSKTQKSKELKDIENLNKNISNVREHVKEIIFGQDEVVEIGRASCRERV